MSEIIYIIASIFAVYYLSLALTTSDGAWGSLARLRALKAVDSFGLLNCFMCTSFWVAVPFGIALMIDFSATWYEAVLLTLFLAGVATLINRLSMR